MLQLAGNRPLFGAAFFFSADVPMVLSWPGASLAPLITLLHQNVLTVDNQAITFSLAFTAHGPVAQFGSTASITRDR
jgi:hypothetical protein